MQAGAILAHLPIDFRPPRSTRKRAILKPLLTNLHFRRRPDMTTNTVRLHRVLRAKPERVYRAFLDPDAMAKWLPPYGFTCKVQQMEAKVGGTYRMSFTNFGTGGAHSFGGKYLELVQGELIRY